MIYLTGDIHGGTYTEKLEEYASPELYDLTRDDYLIILGDFNLPWSNNPNSEETCAWLEERPWTTLFIDGNHEYYPALNALEDEPFYGGRAARLSDYPHLIHLKRGEVFDLPNIGSTKNISNVSLDGLDEPASSHVPETSNTSASSRQSVRIFCMGGAESVLDRPFRREGFDWWPEELPCEEELDYGAANLERVGWRVDYVLTHCASNRMQYRALWPKAAYAAPQPNRLTTWLDTLEDKLGFKYWYMGHYHKDKGLDNKHGVLFDLSLPIGEVPPGNVDEEW